jgi:hypothetical protein
MEMLMLAILDHLNVIKGKREFMNFWADIKAAGLQEPPDFHPMQTLNRLRIGLKHHGNTPNSKAARESILRARGFFENALGLYCQIAYESVSLLDLIPDAEARTMLAAARQKFVEGDKPSAMTDLKIALHRLENPEGKYLPTIQAPRRPSLAPDMMRAGWGTYMNQLHSFLEQCASRTNATMLGIDPIRYAFSLEMVRALNGAWLALTW